jgi:hypothetical protein
MANNSRVTYTYDSLASLAAESGRIKRGPYSEGYRADGDWTLGADFGDAVEMAATGWHDALPEALEVAESAVQMAEKEHMTDSFNQPAWDVTGAQVDVGAYLAGTPECMIDYPLTETSKVGRIITLAASCTVSASISGATVAKRGRLIVALAMALARLGHGVELWVSSTIGTAVGSIEVNVKVKDVNDQIDPATIMFAFAHPAMFRRLIFGICEGKRRGPTGTVRPPRRESFPEGTIMLPEIYSDHDVPNADEFLRKYLGELGLLAE